MNRERVAKWDNIKLFMMLSVVIGHTLYNFLGSSELAKAMYVFIYTYHMPVFFFIAGLFSKNAVRNKKYERVLEYMIIYMVMKFLDTLGDYLQGSRIQFHFFWEEGPGWFALAMAAFLLFTMVIKNLDGRYVLGFAILVGCLAGLDTHLTNHLASLRICVFYPVFLAGYYMDPDTWMMKSFSAIQRMLIHFCSILVLVIGFLLIFINVDTIYPFIKILKGKFDYFQMDMGIYGVLFRALCYIFWALMICIIIFANSNGNRIYTWLGKRTMSIFIWHNFIITLVFRVFKGKKLIKEMVPNYYVLAAVCVAAIICIITAYLPAIRVPSIQKKIVET